MAICENCIHDKVCGLEGHLDEALTFCADRITDVQPVDTKEILRHLDSLIVCVGNAYDTSHYLLESDMAFIEKQEKIIKELLTEQED